MDPISSHKQSRHQIFVAFVFGYHTDAGTTKPRMPNLPLSSKYTAMLFQAKLKHENGGCASFLLGSLQQAYCLPAKWLCALFINFMTTVRHIDVFVLRTLAPEGNQRIQVTKAAVFATSKTVCHILVPLCTDCVLKPFFFLARKARPFLTFGLTTKEEERSIFSFFQKHTQVRRPNHPVWHKTLIRFSVFVQHDSALCVHISAA